MHPKKKQYVDSFRKITVLEKLDEPPEIPELIQEVGQTKNFMRFFDEPLTEINSNKRIKNNDLVNDLVENNYKKQQNSYKQKDFQLKCGIDQYVDISRANKQFSDKTFQFFYGKGTHPSKDMKKESIERSFAERFSNEEKSQKTKKSDIFTQLNSSKYNFWEINKLRRLTSEEDAQEKDKRYAEKEDPTNLIQKIIDRFASFKSLKDILKINQLEMLEKNFRYQLSSSESQSVISSQLQKKLLIKEDSHHNNALNIAYFRDIGFPSRNIEAFVGPNTHIKSQPSIEKSFDDNSHCLSLLNDDELTIDKNKLNFYDIANISMRRVTEINVDLCARGQKVSRADVQRLYKKLQKFQDVEKNEQVLTRDAAVDCVQDFQDEKTNQVKVSNEGKIYKYIEQILYIRKTLRELTGKNSRFIHNQPNTKKQMHLRLGTIIKKIYSDIVDIDKYPMNFLKDNIEELYQIFVKKEHNPQILFLILDCYEMTIQNQDKEDNFKRLNKNKNSFIKINKYKGQKKIKEMPLQIQVTFNKKKNDQEKQINKQKSRTPRKVPILDQLSPTKKKTQSRVTPTKQRTVKNISISPFKK